MSHDQLVILVCNDLETYYTTVWHAGKYDKLLTISFAEFESDEHEGNSLKTLMNISWQNQFLPTPACCDNLYSWSALRWIRSLFRGSCVCVCVCFSASVSVSSQRQSKLGVGQRRKWADGGRTESQQEVEAWWFPHVVLATVGISLPCAHSQQVLCVCVCVSHISVHLYLSVDYISSFIPSKELQRH